jgi:arylformamidase
VLTSDELPRPQMMDAMDENKDGKVTIEEAIAWSKANPRQGRDRRGNRPGTPGTPGAPGAPGAPGTSGAPGAQPPAPGNMPERGNQNQRRNQLQNQATNTQFTVHKDIAYIRQPANPQRQSLDIYQAPQGTDRPVIVYIHGGGWHNGAKEQGADGKAQALDRLGWMLVAINYRLSPDVQHPEHIKDVAAAVAWVHDNIDDYGGDPERIVVMGHSAGAHLAALVATDPQRLAAHGKSPAILDGAILLDGAAYDVPTMLDNPNLPENSRTMHLGWLGNRRSNWADASPILQVDRSTDIPPFLILHTSSAMGAAESKRLGDALEQAGGSAVVLECPDDDHTSINRNLGTPDHRATEAIRIVLESMNDRG